MPITKLFIVEQYIGFRTVNTILHYTTKRQQSVKRTLEKLEISLDPELIKRIDEVVELIGYNSREELILCAIRRYADKYRSQYIKAL